MAALAPLLRYAAVHLTFGQATLHPAETKLGRYTEQGVIGRVEGGWASPALLRVVNALADYAVYCGTGMKTALGMGQTARVAPAPRDRRP